jgi:hypothetical protein
MPDLFDYRRVPDGVPEQVAALFERLTFSLIDRGIAHYSSDAILHRIRWHYHVERGDREFKCNDHWTADLSRWFMNKHPRHVGFFETRVRKSQSDDAR